MKSQVDLINNSDWDILFIIDACRYDYFAKYHKAILGNGGNLQKAISPASWTIGWLDATFKKPIDAIVVSGDRLIRSEGRDPEKIRDISKRLKYSKKTFNAGAHFKKVIDAWKLGDDKEIWHGGREGTVHPKHVCSEVEKAIKSNPNDRIIVFFWQVHDPYFLYAEETVNLKIKPFRYTNLRKVLYEIFGYETVWTILNKLGRPPESWHMYIWTKYGRQGIINGYVHDLKLVLGHIKNIISAYPHKRIVVTGDHGERLGEKRGRYSHGGKRTKIIKEIPWWMNAKV